MSISLSAVRDLLLPGLYAVNGRGGPEVELMIDHATDSIMLIVPGHREILYTRQDIENQAYRSGDLAQKVEAIRAKASVQYIPYSGAST
jgi:hypothetical protein